MKANRVMTRDVVSITPNMKLSAAFELMQRIHARHLPIVSDGRVIGILSDRDVLLHATPAAKDSLIFADRTAGDSMTLLPVTCPPSATVSRVAALMLQHRIDSIPITDSEHRLLGLITSTDLIELLVESESDGQILPFEFSIQTAEEVLRAQA